MSFEPNEYEIRVLRMLNGEGEEEWGAWVGACLEFLQGAGFCTRGPNYRITDKGCDYLARLAR